MFIRLLLAMALIMGLACQQPATEQPNHTTSPSLNFRPNIIWLVAEDQSPNLPSFGDSTVVTPTLSRLAAEGICFDNFYSPHPVCSPARSAIITGMYGNHIGTSNHRTGPWAQYTPPPNPKEKIGQAFPPELEPYEAVPDPEVRMFTEYLREAGYYCTNNSKTDYQFVRSAMAWDECSNRAHWRNRQPGQPFFAVFNFGVTHESRIWAKAEDSLWLPADHPVPVPPYLPDTEVGQRDVRRMYSNVKEMDAQVGRMIAQLQAAGLLDSTIIFWYSDHGGPLPRQKRMLYDSGLKVPLIVRFPGALQAGERDARMTSFIDLAPTVMSLIGLEPPTYMDGKAFLGDYQREVEPKYAFGAADRFDEKTDHCRSVRDERYKYIRYYQPETPMFLNVEYCNNMAIMRELLRIREAGELTPAQALWFREQKPKEELFDVQNDPHEIYNLADDPAYAEKLAELRGACETWVASINDRGLMKESELIELMWPGGERPETADPVLSKSGARVAISCATEGASIGYQIMAEGESAPPQSWMMYQEPVEVPAGHKLVAVADRIGYLRSEVVEME
ncbi:MAG: sulfatase [Bacteroidota bacterium]